VHNPIWIPQQRAASRLLPIRGGVRVRSVQRRGEITFLKIPPFVATLGALWRYGGLTLLMTKG
jgi:hypothetical protein